MSEPLNFDDFQSKYLTIEPGTQKRVKLTNWRQDMKTFQDSDVSRLALIFDVVRVDEKDYYDKPLEWSTTSFSLVGEFRPLIEDAITKKKKHLNLIMKRGKDKRYTIVEIRPSDEVPYVE